MLLKKFKNTFKKKSKMLFKKELFEIKNSHFQKNKFLFWKKIFFQRKRKCFSEIKKKSGNSFFSKEKNSIHPENKLLLFLKKAECNFVFEKIMKHNSN